MIYMLKRLVIIAAIILCSITLTVATSEEYGEAGYFTVLSDEGEELFVTGSLVNVGDQYQSGNDYLYEVNKVDVNSKIAYARLIGSVDMSQLDLIDIQTGFMSAQKGTPRVGIYQTHTAESYVPSDGTESKKGSGGIIDVGKLLAERLEKNGIEVVFSDNPHDPHDKGAYKRSRRTAMELLKKNVDVLIDVHRDAVPAKYYETKVDGEVVSKVRLVVGRQNPNMNQNKQFAQTLKKVADEEVPGLIKDIYYAKGAYNQDLGPRTILIEVGSHKVSKEDAKEGAAHFADVLSSYFNVTPTGGQGKGSGGSIAWLIGITVVGAVVFLFINYGSWSGIKENVIDPRRARYGSALADFKKKRKHK